MFELLKTQKNEIFQIIQSSGLEPANFMWMTAAGPRLVYQNTPYYFEFRLIMQRHYCTYCPGPDLPLVDGSPGSWTGQMKLLKDWLTYLKYQIDAPDLWAEMEKYKMSVSLALPEQSLNGPIAAYRAEDIARKLKMLADRVGQQMGLDLQQSRFVRAKLNYLSEAAKRQRTTDWVHTAMGVSVMIMTGLGLTPEKAQELWGHMRSVLEGFIHPVRER